MVKAAISKSMRKKYVTEKFFYFLLLFITMIVVAFVLGIIIYLIVKGSGAINWEFLSQKPREGMKAGGIFPAIIGTIYLIIGTIIISLPIGIFSAIYHAIHSCMLLLRVAPYNR